MSIPIPKLPYNIYWINLDRRPDRKKHMENILENNKENNFRISAIDFKNDFKPYNVIKHNRLNGGEHGCTCSHVKALYYFLTTSNDEYCFIAEDDLSNLYSEYWTEYHNNLLKKSNYDILQLQTTSDIFNNKKMIPENKSGSGTTFYKIKRNVAKKIVKNHFNDKTLTINLKNHKFPVTDNFIWTFGKVYLLPMFSYLDVTDSDTNIKNKDMENKWLFFFKNAKQKYLLFWKNNTCQI